MSSILFTPGKIGPLTLRNRAIRSAAFEGMCPGGVPSDSLVNYHRTVAAGGVAMTTVAYMAVVDGGRTFTHQAYMHRGIVPELKKLTDAVHAEGALASVQLGHAGNMGDSKVSGQRAVSASSVFTLFGLTLPRKMTEADIEDMIRAHGDAVRTAREAGFDAVEIHAGHGYLISQFISPFTNRRKDRWGGPFENRTRFLSRVMSEVRTAAGNDMAVIVKMNIEDGFPRGMDRGEGLGVAQLLEDEGADALVLSGGFVSKTPFFMMRGITPHRELIKRQTSLIIKAGMIFFSRVMIRDYPYRELFFLDDAMKIREKVSLPLVYVGGIVSGQGIEKALGSGFDFVQIARALLYEPDFINRIKKDSAYVSFCRECGGPAGPCNTCVATMYGGEAECPYRAPSSVK
ncbi:MAG TPA: NADH:flavin oxidoreductase [Spirochaetota bacterium]|nr:NADH:flavin oxidoreductase [Spirochaetota bacterium]HPI90539.1 NADH:flavin oxidoreductase [Spirochaetota bacterium]HPR49136.1 NADH:flavin oxidoreductase [Spirochaetota bacterium]